jgi:hypothetical protein
MEIDKKLQKQADSPNNIIRWLISRILLFVLTQKVNNPEHSGQG